MKFLVDTSPAKMVGMAKRDLVLGQLCTPLTCYKNWGGVFALDNGAYSGLDREAWFRLLKKHEEHMERCLFCVIPDIVGNARRTHELYGMITQDSRTHPYTRKWAYVMQDGVEDSPINWNAMRYIFIGGTDRFKDSSAAYDIVKTAKAIGIPVHVGRVNGITRYRKYADLGADTCDGSGIARYDHMLDKLERKASEPEEPDMFEKMEAMQAAGET